MRKRRVRRNPQSAGSMLKRLWPYALLGFAIPIVYAWYRQTFIPLRQSPLVPQPQPKPAQAPYRTVLEPFPAPPAPQIKPFDIDSFDINSIGADSSEKDMWV